MAMLNGDFEHFDETGAELLAGKEVAVLPLLLFAASVILFAASVIAVCCISACFLLHQWLLFAASVVQVRCISGSCSLHQWCMFAASVLDVMIFLEGRGTGTMSCGEAMIYQHATVIVWDQLSSIAAAEDCQWRVGVGLGNWL